MGRQSVIGDLMLIPRLFEGIWGLPTSVQIDEDISWSFLCKLSLRKCVVHYELERPHTHAPTRSIPITNLVDGSGCHRAWSKVLP